TKSIADRQSPHLTLTLVTGFAAAFTQHRFLLRNCGAMRAKHFTRIRSGHMPEPRLICETGRIKPTQPRMDTNRHQFWEAHGQFRGAHAARVLVSVSPPKRASLISIGLKVRAREGAITSTRAGYTPQSPSVESVPYSKMKAPGGISPPGANSFT